MRPYGFQGDRKTIIADEAAVLATVADRIARGESFRSTATWLNLQGHRTSTNGKWSPISLRRTLTSPRVAGLVAQADGSYTEAEWQPLVDRSTWEKVRLLLEEKTRQSTPFSGPRRYLLTGGIGLCGLCGVQLFPRPTRSGTRGYICRSGPPEDGCGRVRIQAPALEDFVGARVLARLADPRVRTQLLRLGSESAAQAAEEVQSLQRRLTEVSGDYAAGEVSRLAFQEVSRTIQARIDEARTRGKRADEVYLIAPLATAESLAEFWELASVEERRRLVALVLRSVIVGSAVARGGAAFDSTRVRLTWYDDLDH